MAPRRIANERPPYQRKQYTVAELLTMRYALPYLCCPVKKFKPEAWSERILIKAQVPSSDFLDFDGSEAQVLTSTLDGARMNELLDRQQERETLNHFIKKRQQSRGTTPPKVHMVLTTHEDPSQNPVVLRPQTSLSAQVFNESAMRSISLNSGLSGGYGKRILPTDPASNGLMTSMHAFVPGGTLKTVPVTAVHVGDGSDWAMQDIQGLRKTSATLSLSDGLGSKNLPICVPTPIYPTMAINPTTVKEMPPPISKAKGVRYQEIEDITKVRAKVGTAIKEVIKAVVNAEIRVEDRPSAVQAKALMGKRSTSAEQFNWIQAMMNKPIISASKKAPQTKEALGAFTETSEDMEQFIFKPKEAGTILELRTPKGTIVPEW